MIVAVKRVTRNVETPPLLKWKTRMFGLTVPDPGAALYFGRGEGEDQSKMEGRKMTEVEKITKRSRAFLVGGAILTICSFGRVIILNQQDKFWGNLSLNLLIRRMIAEFMLQYLALGFLAGLLSGVGIGGRRMLTAVRKDERK